MQIIHSESCERKRVSNEDTHTDRKTNTHAHADEQAQTETETETSTKAASDLRYGEANARAHVSALFTP